MQSKYDRDLTGWYNLPLPRNICVPRLFYARILLFMAVFRHFFSASKSCESLLVILRDSKFQNSNVILVRFRAFMTETFERHRSNQNRNTNWNEQKIWETFQEKRGLKVNKTLNLHFKFALLYCLSIKNAKAAIEKLKRSVINRSLFYLQLVFGQVNIH